MSVLRELIDLKKDLKDVKSPFVNKRGSIARESNTGVLQFPNLTDSSLSLSEINMINKALEREFVSFISIMTSLDSVTDEKSVRDYITKIHQNFNDPHPFIGGLAENTNVPEFTFNAMTPDYIKNRDAYTSAEEWSLNMLGTLTNIDDDSFVVPYGNLQPCDKYAANKLLTEKRKNGASIFCNKNRKAVDIREAKCKEDGTEETDLAQIFFVKSDKDPDKLDIYQTSLFPKDDVKIDLEKCKTEACTKNKKLGETYDNGLNESCLNDMYKPSNYIVDGCPEYAEKYNGPTPNLYQEADIVQTIGASNKPTMSDMNADSTVNRNQLTDTDVKKANEMQPTLMHLKTYFKDANNSLHAVDYMIGVKSQVHRIDSESMVYNLAKGAKRGRKFFNFVRWTTGEISFFKDFVFAVGNIKEDIRTKFKDNGWWNALIRRKKYAGILSKLNFKQQLVPNTSITISIDTVNRLKSEHGIDLLDTQTAKTIMNEYFMLGLVVVDSSIEVAYVLFDGRAGYEEYSFNALERENSNSAKEVKNIMQVLGRM